MRTPARTPAAVVVAWWLVFLLAAGFPGGPLPRALAEPAGADTGKKLVEEGIRAYEAGRYPEAAEKLGAARPLLPSHSPTVLYLGLAQLKQGRTAEAIGTWQQYLGLEPFTEVEKQSQISRSVQGYLTLMARQENHRTAREAVAREAMLGPGNPRTVAVTYYRNLGSPALAPLQKGLTALLISDLAQVKELTVVERDRLQALVEEMNLGASGLVDKRTAPKVGRLLGAGKVATGSFLDPVQGEIRADSILAESTTAVALGAQAASGKLAEFQKVEKGLALALLKDLGHDEARLRSAGALDRIVAPHTESYAALIAFSQGLELKDQGNYAAARVELQKALAEDPDFDLAKKELAALPLAALAMIDIIAAVEGAAPSSSAATTGLGSAVAAGGGGVSGTTIAIGAGLVAAAAGGAAGAVLALSDGDGGGGDGGPDLCGNGSIDPGERCDGSASPTGCSSRETCASNCGECDPNCGDGETQPGEFCDPPGDQGPCPEGQVCSQDCSGCSGCGNRVRESDEACDPPGERAQCSQGEVCAEDCTECETACGNGTVDGGEVCDPSADPDGCGGRLDCADDCGSCQGCGNGVIEQNLGEECDPGASPTGCDEKSNEACIPALTDDPCTCCGSSAVVSSCTAQFVTTASFTVGVDVTNECPFALQITSSTITITSSPTPCIAQGGAATVSPGATTTLSYGPFACSSTFGTVTFTAESDRGTLTATFPVDQCF